MRRTAAMSILLGALATPAVSPAQAQKVEKYNIGGDGGTDYLTSDPATGRVFISRATHVMGVDGTTGKGVGGIPHTPGIHGIAIVAKSGHGFTTNGRDSTSTMFDLKTLAVTKNIHARIYVRDDTR